jgi:hypothetical protein
VPWILVILKQAHRHLVRLGQELWFWLHTATGGIVSGVAGDDRGHALPCAPFAFIAQSCLLLLYLRMLNAYCKIVIALFGSESRECSEHGPLLRGFIRELWSRVRPEQRIDGIALADAKPDNDWYEDRSFDSLVDSMIPQRMNNLDGHLCGQNIKHNPSRPIVIIQYSTTLFETSQACQSSRVALAWPFLMQRVACFVCGWNTQRCTVTLWSE